VKTKNYEHLLQMRMDVKDLLEYRKQLETKRTKLEKTGNLEKLARINKQCDVMDEVFEAVWAATMMEMVPEFRALTGGDFDIDTLKIALPQYASTNITETMPIEIRFEEAEIVEHTPVQATSEFMKEIEKMLSRSFTKTIEPAIKVYLSGTGKSLPAAEAWKEIKDLLTNNKLIPTWDQHIATQYRMYGPVAAYNAVKKHLPKWDVIEIGHLVEDALTRAIHGDKCTEREAKHLRAILDQKLTRVGVQMYKEDEESIRIAREILGQGTPQRTIEQQIGHIAYGLVPYNRELLEKKSPRKPYVEKGY